MGTARQVKCGRLSTLGGHACAWFLLGEAEGPQEEPAPRRGLRGSGHCNQQPARHCSLSLGWGGSPGEGHRASLTTEPSPILRKKHNKNHHQPSCEPSAGSLPNGRLSGFPGRRDMLSTPPFIRRTSYQRSTLTSVASRASLMRLTRLLSKLGPRAPTAHPRAFRHVYLQHDAALDEVVEGASAPALSVELPNEDVVN